MTAVATTTAATATAYSNQRKIDRCQNGVLWSMFWDGTSNTTDSMHFRYSTDNGETWTNAGGFGFAGTGTTYTPNGSLFIDLDDYAHVVYKDRHDGYIYYRRGTPNTGRTSYSWSAATALYNAATQGDFPDAAAHREGSGWKVHAVWSYAFPGGTNRVTYRGISISSSGTIAPDGGDVNASNNYSLGVATYPSIDFNHAGDGKTVAGSTPHLYAAWSAGATGTGKGIRLKKAAYSAGTWTWGTEREIDSTSFANAGRISSDYDSTRTVIAYADSAATSSIKVRERDAADTTTTTRTPPALSDGVVLGVSVSYDDSGNIYLFALGTTSLDPKWVKYDRAAGTWGSWAAVAAASAQADTLSAKRGYSGGRLEVAYTDGTASPYNVTYGAVTLNVAPNAPILTAPTDGEGIDRNTAQAFTWTFSDPDPGDSQSAYSIRHRPSGTTEWVTVGWTSSTVSSHTFAAATFAAGIHEWQAATKDAAGVEGPWSGSFFFTAGDAPAAPTIDSPANAGTFTQSQPVLWTTASQDAYQLRVLDDLLAVVSDTGEVVSTSARSRTVSFPVNNVTRTIQLRIKSGGLWSPWSEVTGTVSWAPPPTPVVTLTPDNTTGTILVDIINPAPGVGEPAASWNNIFIDDGLGGGLELRASNLTPNVSWTYQTPRFRYDYEPNIQVVAYAENGTSSA